ncbi:MAG TPA: ATP-binding cassette domain-containing protein [Gemmatimonadaceae bacterium]
MSLEFRQICYRVGDHVILEDVTASVAPGELVALVGPNGSGKSTLANVATGFIRPTSGEVFLDGDDITGRSSECIADLGVARTFQGQHLPWNGTVLEVVAAVVAPRSDDGIAASAASPWWRGIPAEASERAGELLAEFGLERQAKTPARDLSFGQQRLLGLAIALARQSTYLILDEPFTGLKGAALEIVIEVLRREAKTKAIVLIDHTLSAVQALAPRLWFMHRGRLSAFESYSEMAASDLFARDYLGAKKDGPEAAPAPAIYRASVGADAEPVLSLRAVSTGYGDNVVLHDVNLDVRKGEIVCVIGLNGSGKSTLLRLVLGLARRFAGEVCLFGESERRPSPDLVTRKGVRLLTQDHRLFRMLTIRDNLMISAAGAGFDATLRLIRPEHSTANAVDRTVRELETAGVVSGRRTAATYSGGEQARVALAALNYGDPGLILLDEPTSGIDGVATSSLRAMVRDWQRQGIPVMIVEHALDFVASIASRVVMVGDGTAHEIAHGRALDRDFLLREIRAGSSPPPGHGSPLREDRDAERTV